MASISRRALLAASAAASSFIQDRAVPPAPVVRPDPEDVPQPGRTDHSRFAVNVETWFRNLPFLDRIRATADLGFDAIEFWGAENKDLDAVAKLCGDLNVEVAQFTAWGFFPGLNDPSHHGNFVKAIQRATEIAKQLGARKATVVGGNDRPGIAPTEMHDHITAGLGLAAPIAESAGLMLLLEPMNIRADHPGHCLHGSTDALRICRQVNSPMVKINWDLYHMQVSEGDLCRRLKEGFDQVGYLQVADNPGRHEPGTGEIHYNRVLREASDLGYRDIIGLECYPRDGEAKAAQRVHRADRW